MKWDHTTVWYKQNKSQLSQKNPRDTLHQAHRVVYNSRCSA